MKIKDYMKLDNQYKEKKNELNRTYELLRNIEEQLDLKDLNSYSYKEIKNIYNSIKNKNVSDKVEEIMQIKKGIEYPQINDVHYFSEIKDIDFLSQEEKVELDRFLAEHAIFRDYSFSFNEKTIDFLISNNIVERVYCLNCYCGECPELQKFNECISSIYYKRIKKPDRTLDNI
ncbi:hypothetical protein KGF51_10015 [Clostridioides sp. ZZV14-6045]|uniref:hypothetical protein n=1 Tax=Clostridioides sp. ZZV14-6045 TaxID=2811489 RepID=UPI001D12394D|nr:hypothetical protein [Clostridioides sp. ZZV14-6045]